MNILFWSVLLVLIYFGLKKAYKNTKDIALNRLSIENEYTKEHSPKLSILHLSDLHLENISITPEELYTKLKDEHIDLIALTGDFLDRKRTIPKLAPYLAVLNQLKAPYGMFAVLGNHDYVLRPDDLNTLIETLENASCKVLINQHEPILVRGQLVNIIGIDDFSTSRSDLKSSYHGIQHGINLVLTHDPTIVLDMKHHHFDYLLAGHFHGGQICYPKAYHLAKMGKLARMNKIKGSHTQDGKKYYINEGLGQTAVNIRIGSRPEITIHELSLASAQIESGKAI
ncbi:metallophosphoesterase [Mesobacillus foraminis]|uniref:metallophosphoesterase n=1 Tax=Mesobacillus foraminis TaxID=279826 RepID=UPI0039A20B6A